MSALATTCCCGCGRRADGPSFSTPRDACNRYRGGKTVRWAAECWRRNIDACERLRAERDALIDAAIAKATGGAG